MRTVGVQCTFAARTSGEGVDQELGNTARVHLEVKLARDRVLPQLPQQSQDEAQTP